MTSFFHRIIQRFQTKTSKKEALSPQYTAVESPPVQEQSTPSILRVELPSDRTRLGSLTLLDKNGQNLVGPHPVMGYADPIRAQQNGNAERLRTKPFGDTPLGTYTIINWIPVPAHLTSALGQHGTFVLDPTSGEAWEARNNGRGRVLLHGGGSWMPTDGALRVHDDTMKELVEHIATSYKDVPIRVDVVEQQEMHHGSIHFSTYSTDDDGSLLDLYWQYLYYYSYEMQEWTPSEQPQEEEIIQNLNQAGFSTIPNDPHPTEPQPSDPVCTLQDPTGEDTSSPHTGAYDR